MSRRCTPRRAASSPTLDRHHLRRRRHAGAHPAVPRPVGAGKTHLLRALRTTAHRAGKAYFGYAQMTPESPTTPTTICAGSCNSLEKPYDPDIGGESALARLTDRLVGDAAVLTPRSSRSCAKQPRRGQARQARARARRRRSSPRPSTPSQTSTSTSCARCSTWSAATRASTSACANTCYGRPLTDACASGRRRARSQHRRGPRLRDHRPRSARLMWTVDRAALVFCIDQVEDLRFFADAQERFQRRRAI